MEKIKHCYYCERVLTQERGGRFRTIDHVIPKFRGGNNDSINRVDCCYNCNGMKGNMMPESFLIEIEYHIHNDLRWKGFSKESLTTIRKNVLRVIDEIVNKYGKLLFKDKKMTPDSFQPVNTKLSLRGDEIIYLSKTENKIEAAIRIPKHRRPISNKIKAMSADCHLSVDTNTPIAKSNERTIYLQHQTPEQFELAKKHGWRVAQALTQPEPNFHEP